MKLHILFLTVLFTAISAYSQKEKHIHRKVYIPLKHYIEKYDVSFQEIDATLLRIKENDTLVYDKDYIQPKGVSVPYEYKDSTFLKYYKKVVFYHSKDSSVNKKTRMKYWKNDIKIFFAKSITHKTRKKLLTFATSISEKIDSLTIYEVKKVENSNHIIYTTNDYNYESGLVNAKSSNNFIYWNGKSQIYKAAIKLNTKELFNEELRLNQLKKYFIQTIGYFKLTDDFDCRSYFSNCYSKNKKLTVLDIELLKYHYSYGICKGTDLETFESQHKRAKLQLKNTNYNMSFFHRIE